MRQVRLCLGEGCGRPMLPKPGDIRGILSRDHAIASVVAEGGGFNQTARALAKIANENAESWLRTIIEAGEGCDAILAAGLAGFVGFSAAEYLGQGHRRPHDPDYGDRCVPFSLSAAQVGAAPTQSR